MQINSQNIVEEIAEIFTSAKYDGIDTLDALEAIRIREKAFRDERQRLATEYAGNSTHTLCKVGFTQAWDYSGNAIRQKTRLETVEVKQRDLAIFASQHGIKLNDLLTLIEHRHTPAIAKDGSQWEVPIMLPANDTVYEPLDDTETEHQLRRIQQVNAHRQASRPNFETLVIE